MSENTYAHAANNNIYALGVMHQRWLVVSKSHLINWYQKSLISKTLCYSKIMCNIII